MRKSEIPTSEFFSIAGDWGQLWIPNLARMSLIECYWMLQNSTVAAFTVFELIRENQLGGKITPPPPPPQPPRLGLRGSYTAYVLESRQVGRTFKLVNPKHEDRASVRYESLSLDLLVC